VPLRIPGRRQSLSVVSVLLGTVLLAFAGCNSRQPLFGESPVAPTHAGALFALTVSPTGVMGGTTAFGTLLLTAPATSGGMVVSLSSNHPAVTVPPTVTIAPGADTLQFPITTRTVTADTVAAIVAASTGELVETTVALWAEQATSLSLWYEPRPGGLVVGRRLTPASGTFTVSCSGSGLSVSVTATGSTPTRVFLAAPTGTPLRPGAYENVRSRFASPAAPALDVFSLDVDSCSTQDARFVVHEAQFGPGTQPIRRFSATFERHCGGDTLTTWGELRLTGVPQSFSTLACLQP
jgi:hypothetical protein